MKWEEHLTDQAEVTSGYVYKHDACFNTLPPPHSLLFPFLQQYDVDFSLVYYPLNSFLALEL